MTGLLGACELITLSTGAWCVHNVRRAETATVPRGTSHVTTKQRCTTSVDIFKKMRCAKLQSLIQSYIMRLECSESARKQRTALYESDQSINQSIGQSINQSMCLMIGYRNALYESDQSINQPMYLMTGVQKCTI